MIHDQAYWEKRYQKNATGRDIGHVSQPLKHIIDFIKDKNIRILIPGAGNSYEADYLLDKGFSNITVIDLAAQPLNRLRERQLNNSSIKIYQEDFFDHSGIYDLILEQTFFCAIESRFRESYINKSYELLEKNGCVEGVLFDFKATKDEPPYPATEEEYRTLFQKKFNIQNLSRCHNSEKSRQGKELIFKIKKK